MADEKEKQQHAQHSAFNKVGPQSIEGIEASDLPDEKGSVETDAGKELKRALPQSTGGVTGGDVGVRGEKPLIDADAHGGRKGN